MFIIIHVLIAISTLAYTSYLYFRPSPDKFSPVYWLLGSTIVSGTSLIFLTGANVLKTCLTGLAFIGVVAAAIIASKHKLAHQTKRID